MQHNFNACIYKFNFILFFLILFYQAIDIFVSKNADMVDYRLNEVDWAQIKSYTRILEVGLLSDHLLSNMLRY